MCFLRRSVLCACVVAIVFLQSAPSLQTTAQVVIAKDHSPAQTRNTTRIEENSSKFEYSRNTNIFCDDCLPWMICDNSRSTCKCPEWMSNDNTIQCDNRTGQLSVLSCHCMTYDNENDLVVFGSCVENCVRGYSDISGYHRLPLDVWRMEQRWSIVW